MVTLGQYLLMGPNDYGPALPGNNYTVARGDSLSSIAAKLLGNANLWRDIWNANPQIDDPNVIEVGTVLNIPGEIRSSASSTSSQAPSGPRMTAVPNIPDDSADTSSSFLSSPLFLVGAAGISLLIVLMVTKKKVAS